MKCQRRIVWVVALAAVFLSPILASSQSRPAAGVVEPRATEILERAGAFLAAIPELALVVEELFDEPDERGALVLLSTVRRMAIRRPDRAVGEMVGDVGHRSFWYDGEQLAVLDQTRNTYAVVAGQATIDATLDDVARRYGVIVPMSELLYSDPASVLLEDVRAGEYVGIHHVLERACHHLAFAADEIDWQIWIDAGPEPLPRRLAITYKNEAGAPQYIATFMRWNLEPSLSDDLFEFKPPVGAEHLELTAVVPDAHQETTP